MKNKKKTGNRLTKNSSSEKVAKYASAPYFKEKDSKAIEFLHQHPIPGKLLK